MGKHNEKLTFEGFPGYYGLMSQEDGYGGFNWSGDFLYMNTSLFRNEPWCNAGYENVASSCGSSALGWIYIDGGFESVKPTETFNLRSMVCASAWSSNQEWGVISYTYSDGHLTEKASDSFYISQYAEKINFSKLGGKNDFRNIAAVVIDLENLGSYGNTCSYGGPVFGYQLAVGDLKVHWNGKIPKHGLQRTGSLPGGIHHLHPTVAAQLHHASHTSPHGQAGHSSPIHAPPDYHSQLLHFGSHGHDGLAAEFTLPHTDHFGF
jgi:hypothetical protein